MSDVLPFVELYLIFLGGSLLVLTASSGLVTAARVTVMSPSSFQQRGLITETSDAHVHVGSES